MIDIPGYEGLYAITEMAFVKLVEAAKNKHMAIILDF